MKENKYDDPVFFEKYSQMERSKKGLAGAGEWSEFKKMMPDFEGKRVLDLGCGYGWHCIYAARNKAKEVLGVDISKKMLQKAREMTEDTRISYQLPVDNYFYEGKRDAVFLGEHVVKYHRTLTTYLEVLLENGFSIQRVTEPTPPTEMLGLPGMKDEFRRPMMLLISAKKGREKRKR